MSYSTEFVSDEYIHLNHCGVQHLYDKNYYMERPCGRADYHILYIFQGVCHTEIFGKPVKVTEGNIILFKPYEKQKYQFHKEDMSISCYLHFTGTGCEALLDDIGFKESRVINIGKSKSILSLFEKTEMEASLNLPFSDKLCASYILEILTLAGRRNYYSSNELFLKNKAKIAAACQFMYDNLSKNISVELCAKECSLSVGRFAHIFKDTMGKTPIEYLTDIRISKAKELLTSYSYSISEVAERVGFANQNYFTRVFKYHTGYSPKKFADENL